MSKASPPVIQQLSPSVINKIAAGEVIERPASVVKELLENGVDAGASQVEVALEQGGTELVRVTDNGWGIPHDQLPLAVATHATSKIRNADDLFNVHTLGFRGEALASIAEVSRLRIRSRVADSDAGHELTVDGGRMEGPMPCASAVGTSVEVRHLFFNTPVRRKFLRTTSTELGHCTEAFQRIALGTPQVALKLLHNQRTVHELPATEDWRTRIAALFGGELADALMWVESHDENLHISGYVANPMHSRSNNRMQYLFLNGRHIRDRSLQHALGEAYRGLLLTGRFPICFLRLRLPPEVIDVNVHPTKLEVRFEDSGRVYSHLLGAIRSLFLTTDLTAQIKPPIDREELVESSIQPAQRQQVRQQVVDWARGGDRRPASEVMSSRPSAVANDVEFGEPVVRAEPAIRFDQAVQPMPLPPTRPVALQAHNRYLVTSSDEGLVIIDQHALHERILYEQFREKTLARSVETQRLLTPLAVHLTAAEAAAIEDHRELLAELGILVEPFGGDTVLVSGYPAMLAKIDPVELVHQLAGQLVQGDRPPDRRDLLDELLHLMSCKAAIKAGDRLSSEEVVALVEQRHLVQDSHHCPHGRPTTLVFTREELDRRFKRI